MIRKLKRLIKPLVPSSLIKKKQSSPFEGVFDQFSDVSCKTDYNIQHSLAEVTENTIDQLTAYEQSSALPKAHSRSQITNLLPLLIAALPSQKVSVLDYGGGAGETFINCLELASNIDLKYHVYDLTETLKQGELLFNKSSLAHVYDIEFCATIDHIKKIDILYFGSVLQYIEDYPQRILSILDTRPEYCLMTDHFFGDHQTYVTTQINMPGRRMPYSIIQLDEIVSILESRDYKLIYNSTNYQPFHNFDGFPEKHRVQDTCNLLFKKI